MQTAASMFTCVMSEKAISVVLFNWQWCRQQLRGKALRSETTEQLDQVQIDLVAKKHVLVSQLASTMSASQVLERDIARLRKETVTTGMFSLFFAAKFDILFMV